MTRKTIYACDLCGDIFGPEHADINGLVGLNRAAGGGWKHLFACNAGIHVCVSCLRLLRDVDVPDVFLNCEAVDNFSGPSDG